MKKILFIVMACVLCIGLVGGAFAYFTANASAAPNTFNSGTLVLDLSNASQPGPSVTDTWTSPANWAPGQSVTASLTASNTGSIPVDQMYFGFENLTNAGPNETGSDNLMNEIIVTSLTETFDGVTTSNEASSLFGGTLTLAQLCDFDTGTYGYYTYNPSNTAVLLAPGDKKDYSLNLVLTFDPTAGNDYQGASCGFDMMCRADQMSPTAGMICFH